MLECIDLAKKLKKKEAKELLDKLDADVARLQREAKACGIPVMIIFEGWGASGKGTLINRLIQPMDPRGRRRSYETVFVAFLDKNPCQGKNASF